MILGTASVAETCMDPIVVCVVFYCIVVFVVICATAICCPKFWVDQNDNNNQRPNFEQDNLRLLGTLTGPIDPNTQSNLSNNRASEDQL